jgi:hypothetical protein
MEDFHDVLNQGATVLIDVIKPADKWADKVSAGSGSEDSLIDRKA